ncbi:glycosyltransferase [Polynucleobacter rarus]|uniref:glycosyltransferase n=1 Tax=Polynucleobacter rarus TaxID=556055 RepID=UPI000D3E5FB3|nr:glycosyltransferase [Polynucleobacter rarus]
MIKVLGLALYGPLAASHRYRLSQYVIGLEKVGIQLEIYSLLGDEYLKWRFSGGKIPISNLLLSGLNRFIELSQIYKYDLAILQCELFPFAPGFLEKAFIRKPYIYDFDDAFYLKYRTGRYASAKKLLGNKFDRVISGSTSITAGNHQLVEYASKLNIDTNYLPTVVDTEKYIPNIKSRNSSVFNVGWIGSPSTSIYLNELIEPLSKLAMECSVRLIIIGAKAPIIPNIEVVEIKWSEATEVDLINTFDVGVMPLIDTEWERGKCAFKLIQYLACSVPVIASPVGANKDVVNESCGLFASNSNEWLEAFRILRDNQNLRYEMGSAGREIIIRNYSLEMNLPIFSEIIKKVSYKK